MAPNKRLMLFIKHVVQSKERQVVLESSLFSLKIVSHWVTPKYVTDEY